VAEVIVAINVQSSEPDMDVVGVRVILAGDSFSPDPVGPGLDHIR